MISAAYIASAATRLELELKIIRHFLLHPHAKEVRDAFVAAEMKERTESMKGFLAQKADRDRLDDLLAPSILRSHERWLENNLHHLKEFSENRLNQMELILRYALFEGFLQKIIGNILWEYPALRNRGIHAGLERKSSHKKCYDYHKRTLQQHPEGERIAWTIATVEAVDHLHFDQWKREATGSGTVYLWKYLNDAFGLAFPQKELWPTLERLRRIRNHVVHRSLELTISGDRMKDAQVYLGNFPALLVQTAAKPYPKACTEEPPDEGDDGTPAYVLHVLLKDYF